MTWESTSKILKLSNGLRVSMTLGGWFQFEFQGDYLYNS